MEESDINFDGVTDYIIRYKDGASNYGEFLYNVIISDGAFYRKGFSSDDYFVELHFQDDQVVGPAEKARPRFGSTDISTMQ